MSKNKTLRLFFVILVMTGLITPVLAQKSRRPVIFAVLQDGRMLEPIAFLNEGKLTSPDGDGDALSTGAEFGKVYYKKGAKYNLVFGGANAGTATVTKFESVECMPNMALASVASKRTKLGGFVMGLAVDQSFKVTGSGVRRKPTAAEKSAIDSIVRAEFQKNKVAASALKVLRYHNLTAIDANSDGKIELVGSYWAQTSATARALLFFIAEPTAAGKFKFAHSEYREIKQDEVMSGEISAVDNGVYHELLLDVLDYNADGTSEIFTYVEGFEGASFFAYRKMDGKWVRDFEGSNYHCGY